MWQLSNLSQTLGVTITNYFDNKYWGVHTTLEGLVKSSNNGLTWQNSFSGIKQADCKRLSVSRGTIYSMGNFGSFVFDTINSIWNRFTEKGYDFKGTLGNDSRVYDIKKGSSTTLYLASEGGVWTSTNNGSTWTQHLAGLPQQTVPTTSCTVNRLYIFGTGGNDTIIAATATGIYYSTNQAQSFIQATGANNGNFNDMVFAQGKLFAGGNGIYSSTNRGITWTAVNNITSGLITQIAATNTKLWVIANQYAAFTNIGPDTGLHGLMDGTLLYGAQFLTAYDSLVFINHPGVVKINESLINSSGSNAGDIDVDVAANLPNRPVINVFGDTLYYYADYAGAGDLKVFNDKLWLGTQNLSTFYRNMSDFGYLNPTVAVSNRNENKIGFVYPNPANDNLTLELVNATDANAIINIYGAMGQRVFQQQANIKAGKITIDISQLSSGMYHVQLIGANSKSLSQSFIKK